MPDIKCEKCGETLKEDALTCWACGTLTPAGRRAREAGQDDDDAWRQSVEAARRRQSEQPAMDPEAVLQRVLVDTGQDLPVTRRRPEPVLDLRRDSQKLLASAETLGSLGALLAFLTSLGGLLAAVVGILSGNTIQLLAGLAAFIAVGGLALYAYFQCKFLAEMGRALTDALQQLNRLQVTLQELRHEHHEADGGTE
jgi:hypothetical protein